MRAFDEAATGVVTRSAFTGLCAACGVELSPLAEKRMTMLWGDGTDDAIRYMDFFNDMIAAGVRGGDSASAAAAVRPSCADGDRVIFLGGVVIPAPLAKKSMQWLTHPHDVLTIRRLRWLSSASAGQAATSAAGAGAAGMASRTLSTDGSATSSSCGGPSASTSPPMSASSVSTRADSVVVAQVHSFSLKRPPSGTCGTAAAHPTTH